MNNSGHENFDSDYRPNVGIMLVNRQHKVLAGEVIHRPGKWMMPQGGIDRGESPHQALQRELIEETGIKLNEVRLIEENPDWIKYQFLKPLVKDGQLYIGQTQKWFLLEYNGPVPDAQTMIDREFSLFEWVEKDWLIEHTTKFKKDVYRTIFDSFDTALP